MTIQHLRVARPTGHLGNVVAFYRELFDFEVIAAFENHDGFDGVMLGHPGREFHLEFTHERGQLSPTPASREQLLVFYLAEADWRAMQVRLESAGVRTVPSSNPYWDRNGVTVVDPDGNRIVLHRGPWTAER